MSSQELTSLFPEVVADQELFTLRREDQLIVSPVLPFDPVYFDRGAGYITDFLDLIGKPARTADLLAGKPELAQLLPMLLAHGVVRAADRNLKDVTEGTRCTMGCIDPKPMIGEKTNYVLYLLISQACNMACVYCLAGRETYENVAHLNMPREVAFESIRKGFSSLTRDGEIEISFFGGEPLLNYPLAVECIDFCEELRKDYPDVTVRYHFTTNLSMLPDGIVELAKRYNITFLVELDGPKELHDITRPSKNGSSAYDTIVRNVKALRKADLNVTLRTTVTCHNHHKIKEIAEHHLEIGVENIAFVPLNPVNSDLVIFEPEMLPDPDLFAAGLEAVYKARMVEPHRMFPLNEYVTHIQPGALTAIGCGMPMGNTPVVNTDGEVYACIWLMGQPQFKIGDLKERFLRQEVLERFVEMLHVDRLDKCRDCQLRYLCGGGCPVRRMSVEPNAQADARVLDYYDRMTCRQAETAIAMLLWDKGAQRLDVVKTERPHFGCTAPLP